MAMSAVEKHYVEPIETTTPEVAENRVQSTTSRMKRYDWVEKAVEKGLPDGRKRFILHVLSAYLVNIKHLGEDEAFQEVQEFLENSCRNFDNCEKIYESFIRGDLQRVKSKGLKTVSLEKLREKDPELYSLIEQALTRLTVAETQTSVNPLL